MTELLFPPTPLWRPTDPATSREAGLGAIGKREGLRARVLEAIGLTPNDLGLTDDEIVHAIIRRHPDMTPVPYKPTVVKRRSELSAGRWIRANYFSNGDLITRNSDHGRPQAIWLLTTLGRQYLFEVDRPADCGEPMMLGRDAIVCSLHGAGCTRRSPS